MKRIHDSDRATRGVMTEDDLRGVRGGGIGLSPHGPERRGADRSIGFGASSSNEAATVRRAVDRFIADSGRVRTFSSVLSRTSRLRAAR